MIHKKSIIALVVLALAVSLVAFANPKTKTYNVSADVLFKVALKVTRENHVVSYMDREDLTFSFTTGQSWRSEPFRGTASVKREEDGRSTLVVSLQGRRSLLGPGAWFKKFFSQVDVELQNGAKDAEATPTKATDQAGEAPA